MRAMSLKYTLVVLLSWLAVLFVVYLIVGHHYNTKKAKRSVCSTKWNENSYSGSFEMAEEYVKRNAFKDDKFSFLGLESLQYKFCFDYHTSGNRFGDYFNALGCAHAAGLHFQVDGPLWPFSPYLSAIPRFVRHPIPTMSKKSAVSKIQLECQSCKYWCWEDQNAPWIHALPLVKRFMHKAALQHVKGFNSTILNLLTDLSSANLKYKHLPVIPDVALQYRCGDNIEQDANRYGFISFKGISDRIPRDAKFIYILSDPPERSEVRATAFNSKCKDIISAFHSHIVLNFPGATVIAKRGGDPFLDFARFTLADTTVCSSSTFCLWPALANRNNVFLPTSLTMGGANKTSKPFLGKNIHFLVEPLIGNFTKETSLEDILKVLRS
jgi:hypothetical protein